MTNKAKVSRENILLHEECFSYLFFKGSSKHNPIIFFHATGLNAATYLNLLTKIYDNFDGERSIYAFDQRGHGLSEAEADHKKLKSWRQFSKEAITFLNALGHESVELMGHSMGGIVASEIASQLKLKVNNLIMLEPVLYYEPKEVIKLKIKPEVFWVWEFDYLPEIFKIYSNYFNIMAKTLEQTIGQLIIAGFKESTITTKSDIVRYIKDYNISGVILYDEDMENKRNKTRNVISQHQLQNLTKDLQDSSDNPLLISIDQVCLRRMFN